MDNWYAGQPPRLRDPAMRTSRPPTPQESMLTHAEDPERPGTCGSCTRLGVSGDGLATGHPCAAYRFAAAALAKQEAQR